MYILIKLFQITLLLFVSFTLHLIPWTPSLLIENIVNFSILGLFIVAGYLVYLVMKRLYDAQKKRNVYISTIYALLLFSYLGIFAIGQIGVSLGESKYMKSYDYDSFTFYTYRTVDGGTEVSMQDAHLPIRSLPIATFPDKNVSLKKEETFLYAVADTLYVKIYDFKHNTIMEDFNIKEKND